MTSKNNTYRHKLNEITARLQRDYCSPVTRLCLAIILLLIIGGLSPCVMKAQITAGMYYIKIGDVYVWRAITEKEPGQPYLSGLKTTSYSDDEYSFGPAHCSWIIKPVTINEGGTDKTYYTFINVGTNQYVVWDFYDSGKAQAVHLETRANEPTRSSDKCFFKYELSGDKYYIHPDECTAANRGLNYKGEFKEDDKLRERTNNPGRGLIQFYNGTANAISQAALLVAPTISDVSPENNKVTITENNSLPAGYKIRYTFSTEEEPADPKATSTVITDGEYQVTVAGTLKVVVERYGIVLTAVASKYVEPYRCATPVISYSTEDEKITITTETADADIYYTLDGTPPTSNSTLYEGPFAAADQTTVKAIATKSGYSNSEVASSKLVLNPTITLAENEYTYSGSAIEPAVSNVKDGETTINTDEYTVSYSNNINAGNEAVVRITDAEGGDYIVYGSKTFTINPAGVTLTANSGTEAYDGTEKTVTGFASSVNGLTFEGVNASGSGTIAGEYDVTLTGVTINTTKDTSGNYVVTSTVNGKLTITPKALTITAKPVTITYGEEPTNDGVTYGEFAPGEDESVLSGTLAYAYNYAQYDDAGNYTITPSGLSNDNYNITFAPGVLTVAKKEVGLTWDETTSFVYDGSAHAPTATASGMINGDVISVTVIGAQINAGDYTATASLTGDKAGSYQLPDAHTQEFSITKVPLTITANNNAITYGNAPAGNGVTCVGFVNSETASVLGGTLDYDYSYTQYGDVGNTYTITPKGLTSVNYEITFAAGTLTVNAKEVSLSWGETTFEYDGSPHAPIATAIGLVNSDVVTVTVTGAQINVGNYTATASALTGDKAGNYLLPDDNTQSFTISRRNIGSGTLVSGYTLDFGEDNTILLTDDNIGRTLVLSTDYSVGDDTDPSAKYSERRVTGQGNYTGYFDVRNVVISFTTDTDQEDWSATFSAEKADESDVGLALPEGASAFIISGIQGEWAIPEPLNYIPAGVPVLLVAHKKINGFVATQTESGDVTPITDVQKTKNMLEEVTETTPGYDPVSESAPFATKQIYLLYKNEFVFNKAGNMKKGKVYLNPNHAAPSPEPAPSRLQIAWNYTTGIEDGKGKMDEGRSERWYTLDGRCLSGKPDAKGLYIVGGKKIVVK